MIAVVQFLMLLAILVLAALLLIWLGAPFWLTVLVLAALYMTLTTVPTLMLTYKSKNLRAIDRFLLRNSRKPIYKFAYSVAHGTDDEIRASLLDIMSRYKQPDIRHVYGALYAVTEKDGDGVLSHAGKIGTGAMQSYYEAYGHALNGDNDRAEAALSDIPEGHAWMRHAIRAVMAHRQGDRMAFRREAGAAKDRSGGIQFYLLHHNFRKLEESAAHQ